MEKEDIGFFDTFSPTIKLLYAMSLINNLLKTPQI